jgi:hypothetical protein
VLSDGPAGKVRYSRAQDDLATPGHHTAQFYVGDAGSVRFASVPITFRVRRALGPIPAV